MKLAALVEARWEERKADAWERVELGLREEELAALVSLPFDKAFRQQLWAVREMFRERTGRQIVIVDGALVVLSAQEQVKYAKKHRKKARIKARRAVNVAASVPLEQLPEAERGPHARRVEKMAQLVALEEVASRKRDVLEGLGLGEEMAGALKVRAAEAQNRSAAWERLFKK